MVNLILSNTAGFCFGVQRAVDIALNSQKQAKDKIYTLGPLIHNKDVVNFLKDNLAYPIELSEINNLHENDSIIIRSHGVTPSVIELLKSKKLNIIDATCPYVSNIHKKVLKYYNLGYIIVIVGDKDHPEVIGINGWCNDTAIIAAKGDDIPLEEIQARKICIVSQTTEKQINWNSVLKTVQNNCEEIVSFNTICNATEIRQKSANEISKEVDVMIVIGGKHSSNTTKLYEICKTNCINTIHVENAGEIPDDIIKTKTISNIGVTAGASTPDWIIEEAITKMNSIENVGISEFEKLMNEYDINIHVGKVVKATVEVINDEEALVSIIGYKGNGVIPLRELTLDPSVNIRDILNVGDELDAKVKRMNNTDDMAYLSKLDIQKDSTIKELQEIFDNKANIIVKVGRVIKGGVLSNYKDVSIFIPASQLDNKRVDNLENFMGKELEVTLIEFKRDRRGAKIVASRRALLPNSSFKKSEYTSYPKAVGHWDKIQKDTLVTGLVKRLTDFGAFIEVCGVDGLLHLSEISWDKISKVSDVVNVGETITVYVLDINEENKKLSLSLKRVSGNPWDDIENKYKVGDIVKGKIVRFSDFGAFVKLESGVDSLLHISKISQERIEKPSDLLELGQEVEAKILEVNKDSKRISLSIKDI
ncbi:MAG: bifunctional 4-hydroxy-3-methylbut-2-enyl diphosphate reductase/30S ribosomal protein S1 [Clostridium sp.]